MHGDVDDPLADRMLDVHADSYAHSATFGDAHLPLVERLVVVVEEVLRSQICKIAAHRATHRQAVDRLAKRRLVQQLELVRLWLDRRRKTADQVDMMQVPARHVGT